MRKLLSEAPILKEFDRNVFESIVEKVIVGGYDDEGNADPSMITFVYKTGFEDKKKGDDYKLSGGELRAEVLANYLRHERLPDCTFLPENALYQRTYGTLPEGGVIIQQSHKRSQAARSFAA